MALLIPNLIAIGIASVTTIIDTAFASYLSDHASIATIKNALLLYGLPSVLLASAVGQALLPQITTHASQRCNLRMRQTILKIGRGTMLLSAPAALILCFYALKDARTPLFTNIAMVALHVALLAILVKVFTGPEAILGILLTTAVTGTVEAAFLCLILFTRLHRMVKTDKGLQRLLKRRLQVKTVVKPQ